MSAKFLPLLVALGPLGCTAIVVTDLVEDRAPCADPSDCAAGFVCENGACAERTTPGVPPREGIAVDENGGVVEGPDGVVLTIPAGALDGQVFLAIERASSTIVPTGVDDVTPFYRVTPLLLLSEPATMSIPVDDACADCALFLEPEDADAAWIALPRPAVSLAGAVSGLVESFGDVIVVGTEAP